MNFKVWTNAYLFEKSISSSSKQQQYSYHPALLLQDLNEISYMWKLLSTGRHCEGWVIEISSDFNSGSLSTRKEALNLDHVHYAWAGSLMEGLGGGWPQS